MLQRDNLVRSLGVVELVHRLLQSSQAPTGYPPVFKDKVVSSCVGIFGLSCKKNFFREILHSKIS